MAKVLRDTLYGRSGVYDSPMATDYYVKRFGFLFGGGRSGAAGLAALQVKHHLIATLGPILKVQLIVENLASLNLQDRATKWHYKYGVIMGGRNKNFKVLMQSDQVMRKTKSGEGGFLLFTLYVVIFK